MGRAPLLTAEMRRTVSSPSYVFLYTSSFPRGRGGGGRSSYAETPPRFERVSLQRLVKNQWLSPAEGQYNYNIVLPLVRD
jgi:hypothetical protein